VARKSDAVSRHSVSIGPIPSWYRREGQFLTSQMENTFVEVTTEEGIVHTRASWSDTIRAGETEKDETMSVEDARQRSMTEFEVDSGLVFLPNSNILFTMLRLLGIIRSSNKDFPTSLIFEQPQ
jgi:hypothetical protein